MAHPSPQVQTRRRPWARSAHPSTAAHGLVRTALVVGLVLVGVVLTGLPAASTDEAVDDTTLITGSLPDGHVGMFALPLADGDALVLAANEVGGPAVATSFRWRSGPAQMEQASDLLEARVAPGVSLLSDGDVLVSGGLSPDGVARTTAEVLSAGRRVAESTGTLNEARANHSSTLLPDGRVLVVGGIDAVADEMSTLATAELWDSETGHFTVVGSLEEPRYGHAAVGLPDGRVAIIGGVTFTGEEIGFAKTVEVWSPEDGEFTTVAEYPRDAVSHTATLLGDGRILVVGGITDGGADVSDDVDIWDPVAGTFELAGTLRGARAMHTATLLDDGSVVIIGGQGLAGPLATVETWHEATGMDDAGTQLRWARSTPAVAALADGRVLAVGGFGDGEYLSTYEIWAPARTAVFPVESDGSDDVDH